MQALYYSETINSNNVTILSDSMSVLKSMEDNECVTSNNMLVCKILKQINYLVSNLIFVKARLQNEVIDNLIRTATSEGFIQDNRVAMQDVLAAVKHHFLKQKWNSHKKTAYSDKLIQFASFSL